MLVASDNGDYVGSLSGGCVEEEFLNSLSSGAFSQPVEVICYGETSEESRRLQLPCGGSIQVLVEHPSSNLALVQHLLSIREVLQGQQRLIRQVELGSGQMTLLSDAAVGGERIEQTETVIKIRLGPVLRIVLAGFSPVAEACAGFAQALGCEVIACDPREEVQGLYHFGNAQVLPTLPSVYIASGQCHQATAVLALTHDPKIDDLAMMEAVRTPAFYIGVMGSKRTSAKRAERLKRLGSLDDESLQRLHMPIGLNLGSKTPAEIGLATMADVLRVYRGRARSTL
ncbi:xanthine dehydrogenase accessory factor [Marinobacterium lutimaris]|uniref:Xanthine dehydrogenase accessory factor n=2 Tax=Marinobacterium lutimaris TaxID=568106 RepID=A0A1H6AKE1_9GAMM|nr:xanthine dehydrogenase accessory factor [Marinobacterium lutimaris]